MEVQHSAFYYFAVVERGPIVQLPGATDKTLMLNRHPNPLLKHCHEMLHQGFGCNSQTAGLAIQTLHRTSICIGNFLDICSDDGRPSASQTWCHAASSSRWPPPTSGACSTDTSARGLDSRLTDCRCLAREAALPHVPSLSSAPSTTLYCRMSCVLLVLGSLVAGSLDLRSVS